MKKRLLAIVLALTTVFAGCGFGASDSDYSYTSGYSGISEDILAPDTPVPDEKLSINDFYQYALGDWINETNPDDVLISASYNDCNNDKVFSELAALIDGKSAEDFPEEIGVQKLLLFRDQLNAPGQYEKSTDCIKSMYEEIESAKNIADYLNLFYDFKFFCVNRIFRTRYEFTSAGDYVLRFETTPYGQIYVLSDEESKFLEKEFTDQFMLMGISKEEAAKKAADAISFNNMILAYYNAPYDESNYLEYWNEASYAESGYTVPLIDIQKAHGFVNEDHYGHSSYCFFCYTGNMDFYTAVLTDENLPLLKAYLEVTMFESLFYVGSPNMQESQARISSCLNGYPLDKIENTVFIESDEASIEAHTLSALVGVDSGHLATLYRDANITDDVLAEINEIADKFRLKYVDMLKESDWLSERIKEKMIQKIKKIRVDVGAVNGYSSYEDVEIGESPVDTLISFIKSNQSYGTKYLRTEEGLPNYTIGFYNTNGNYVSDSNSVLLPFATIKMLTQNENASEEEKLGYFGSVLAHEFAHALVPDLFFNGVDGIYMDYASEEEINTVWAGNDAFALVIDGKQSEHGNTVNGWRCSYEYMADVFSVNCLLRVLDDMENPDYDTFFTNYARSYGVMTSPSAENSLMRTGTHLLGRLRVNSVLYQFDKLYELYNIETTNEYYIPTYERKSWY